NSRQDRNSLVTISMKVSGGSYRSYTLPSPAIEPFELTIKCDDCGARFAVIGSAFFCPCCGRYSAEKMFDSSLEKIEAKLGNLDAYAHFSKRWVRRMKPRTFADRLSRVACST